MSKGYLKESYDKFVKTSVILYNYMLQHFEIMFDNNIIKHFDIESGFFGINEYVDEIKEKYNDDIQNALIIWIKNELEKNQLFEYKNWKPFRDQDILTYMFLGYRKLFKYNNYFLQLVLFADCENSDICKYCKNEDNRIHFGLTLYGWKDNKYEKLQPLNNLIILNDDLIPESLWNITY